MDRLVPPLTASKRASLKHVVDGTVNALSWLTLVRIYAHPDTGSRYVSRAHVCPVGGGGIGSLVATTLRLNIRRSTSSTLWTPGVKS